MIRADASLSSEETSQTDESPAARARGSASCKAPRPFRTVVTSEVPPAATARAVDGSAYPPDGEPPPDQSPLCFSGTRAILPDRPADSLWSVWTDGQSVVILQAPLLSASGAVTYGGVDHGRVAIFLCTSCSYFGCGS